MLLIKEYFKDILCNDDLIVKIRKWDLIKLNELLKFKYIKFIKN